MGYELRMSAEIHDWLTTLRREDPPAAVLVTAALTALAREGAALGPPLVTPVAVPPADLPDALDQAYQDNLATMQIVRRRTADAALLARDILSQVTELDSLRDRLTMQRQRALEEDMPEAAAQAASRLSATDELAAGLRRRLPGVIEAERQLTDTSLVLHARSDAFRTRKDVLKAVYFAAQAERQLEEELAPGDAESGEAAARLADVTGQIERELRDHAHADDLLELRTGALRHSPTSAPEDSATEAPHDSESADISGTNDPDDGGIRILFAVEPPGTALLIAVLEDNEAVRDHYREAVLLSAGVLRRARVGQAPEAAAFGYDDAPE